MSNVCPNQLSVYRFQPPGHMFDTPALIEALLLTDLYTMQAISYVQSSSNQINNSITQTSTCGPTANSSCLPK